MTGITAVVLGIDAAWTSHNPSGVALAVRRGDNWMALAASASYGEFLSTVSIENALTPRPTGSVADLPKLLDAALMKCGRAVDVIAVDMPLAMSPIVTRRASDNLVSKAYGGRKCSTHTPSSLRPGKISDDLRLSAHGCGYPLLVSSQHLNGLIEVYPHPALVELMGAAERLPYKETKIRNYWPTLSPPERRARLFDQWRDIALMLDREMSGAAALLKLPSPDAPTWQLKAHEDKLDALICAAVAKHFLDGGCKAFGDTDSAIWIPASHVTAYRSEASSTS